MQYVAWNFTARGNESKVFLHAAQKKGGDTENEYPTGENTGEDAKRQKMRKSVSITCPHRRCLDF